MVLILTIENVYKKGHFHILMAFSDSQILNLFLREREGGISREKKAKKGWEGKREKV